MPERPLTPAEVAAKVVNVMKKGEPMTREEQGMVAEIVFQATYGVGEDPQQEAHRRETGNDMMNA